MNFPPSLGESSPLWGLTPQPLRFPLEPFPTTSQYLHPSWNGERGMLTPPRDLLATGPSIADSEDSTWTKVESKKKKKKKNTADEPSPISSTAAAGSPAKSPSPPPTNSVARKLNYCEEGALYVHHLKSSTSEDDLIDAFQAFTGDRKQIRVHLHLHSYKAPFAWVDLGDKAAAERAVQAAKAGERFNVGNDRRVLGVYPWRRPGMESGTIASHTTTPPPQHATPPSVREWARWLTDWVRRRVEKSNVTSVPCKKLQPFYTDMASEHGARVQTICKFERPQVGSPCY